MTERGPSLAEIIVAKLAGAFHPQTSRRALPPVLVQPALRAMPAPVPCVADDRLIAAYRDLLRMPV